MVVRRSGSGGAVTAVVAEPELFVSERSTMTPPGSTVAETVIDVVAEGSRTETGIDTLPPLASVPPEHVAVLPAMLQIHPVAAAAAIVAPPAVIRTDTALAVAPSVELTLPTLTE